MCINVRKPPWKWPTGIWRRWEDNMIVRVGKRIVSGAFLMIEYYPLKPSGNYIPHSVTLKILHFVYRAYLCVLYDWHIQHLWNCIFYWHCICAILPPLKHKHFCLCMLQERIILLRYTCKSLPCIRHHHIPNMRFIIFTMSHMCHTYIGKVALPVTGPWSGKKHLIMPSKFC
jgi:hypothetical protein